MPIFYIVNSNLFIFVTDCHTILIYSEDVLGQDETLVLQCLYYCLYGSFAYVMLGINLYTTITIPAWFITCKYSFLVFQIGYETFGSSVARSNS